MADGPEASEFGGGSLFPQSTAGPSAWELPEPLGDAHQEAYKKAIREGMNKVCKEFGGPENYFPKSAFLVNLVFG